MSREKILREYIRELIQESHFPLPYAVKDEDEVRRIHHSRAGSRVEDVPQASGFTQQVGRKPNGLWYECQDGSKMDWKTFCDTGLSTKYSKRYDSTYNVVLDEYLILFIPDTHYFDKFASVPKPGKPSGFRGAYGIPHPAFPRNPKENLINWPKVAEHYSGIEICPYIGKRREVTWYYGWDVASGCVWSQQGIQELRKIKC